MVQLPHVFFTRLSVANKIPQRGILFKGILVKSMKLNKPLLFMFSLLNRPLPELSTRMNNQVNVLRQYFMVCRVQKPFSSEPAGHFA